jgi:hypothetical protein
LLPRHGIAKFQALSACEQQYSREDLRYRA